MIEMTPGAVTLADLFRVLSAMQADLAKMTTQMEVINSRNAHADETDRDHEARLRVIETAETVSPDDFADLKKQVGDLEVFRWKLAGMMLTVSVLSGALAALVVWALSRHA